jgi:hypothetical protein
MNKRKSASSEWVKVPPLFESPFTEHSFRVFEKWATGDPVLYWRAIKVCIEEKEEFPPWVIAYLDECANRMLSTMLAELQPKQAGKSWVREVSKTLQWILGFPEKGMGPGKMFFRTWQSVLAGRKHHFALEFVKQLPQVKKVSDARGNAGSAAFGKDITDRILRKYLREEFQVSKLPSTHEEWEPVIRRYRDDVKAGKRTYYIDNC